MPKIRGAKRNRERAAILREATKIVEATMRLGSARGRRTPEDNRRCEAHAEAYGTAARDLESRASTLDPPDEALYTATTKLWHCVLCLPGPDGPCEQAQAALVRARTR